MSDEFDKTMKDIKDGLIARIIRQEKEIQELKANLEMYENGVYFSSQVDELEKKYDRMKENAETLSKGYDDLQARIDKAIEYIEENYPTSTINYQDDKYKLLKILKGDSSNE